MALALRTMGISIHMFATLKMQVALVDQLCKDLGTNVYFSR